MIVLLEEFNPIYSKPREIKEIYLVQNLSIDASVRVINDRDERPSHRDHISPNHIVEKEE